MWTSEKVTGDCRIFYELRNSYFQPNVIQMIKLRAMRWVEHVERVVQKINAYTFWYGKPEGRRATGRPKYRWEGDIKMDLKKQDGRKWTGLIWMGTGKSGWVL